MYLWAWQEGGVHILGAPVIQNDGTLTGIIELYRSLYLLLLVFDVNNQESCV